MAVNTQYTISICEIVRQAVDAGIVNAVTACDYLGSDVILWRTSERLECHCNLAMPSGQPLTSFAHQLLSDMRVQLETDLIELG